MKNSFGSVCRQWRKQRRYSQLQLAMELDISSKHVSFIETGRSVPSREMILKIGNFLYLPKREINRGLYSAGYAPAYRELSVDGADLRHVLKAIDQVLSNHMPYPAIVLNESWDVVKANEAAQQLLGNLGMSEHKNLVGAVIADDPATSKIINWQESAQTILIRLRHEISIMGGSERLEALEKRLVSCLPDDQDIFAVDTNQPVLSLKLQLFDRVLSFFSIIAQLGTVQDVVVSEFRVELMFPTDEITVNHYKCDVD